MYDTAYRIQGDRLWLFFFLTLLYLSDNWSWPATCSRSLSNCLSRDPVPQTEGQALPPHTACNLLRITHLFM
jgi:hypothetical protein